MNRTARYFVSYAHDDNRLAAKLLAELKNQFGASKGYDFIPWRDTDITRALRPASGSGNMSFLPRESPSILAGAKGAGIFAQDDEF